MAVNKIIYGGRTLINISDSTVTAEKLLKGLVAYSASGERLVGTMDDLTAFAFISVEYPQGATLTCTSGNTSLIAADTTGRWMFSVPGPGTWQVTAVNGSLTVSQTVSITDEGQHETIALHFEFVLFDAGTYAAETGGFNYIDTTNGLLTAYAAGNSSAGNSDQRYSLALIDLSAYSTLHFQVTASSGSGNGYRRLGVSSEASGNINNMVAQVETPQVGEVTIDISNITAPVAILIACLRWGTSWSGWTLSVSRIWATA